MTDQYSSPSSSPSPQDHEEKQGRHRERKAPYLIFVLGMMALIVLVDQISKYLVVASLEPYEPYPVLGDWFRLYLIRNPGAAFSLGESYTLLFSTMQALAVVVVFYLALKVENKWQALALALIGGGAAGNLCDRIFRAPSVFRGHVVDFFSFWDFAIFNIADSAISVGVGVYICTVIAESWFTSRSSAPANTTLENTENKVGMASKEEDHG